MNVSFSGDEKAERFTTRMRDNKMYLKECYSRKDISVKIFPKRDEETRIEERVL